MTPEADARRSSLEHAVVAWASERAARAAATWFGRGQDALFAGVEADLPVIDALIELVLADASREHDRAVATLIADLWPFWVATGRIPPAARALRLLAERVEADAGQDGPDADARFRWAWALAWFALCVGDVAAAESQLAHATRIAGPTPAPAHVAAIRQLDGIRCLYEGEADRAQTLLLAALDHDTRRGAEAATFIDLSHLAMAASLTGRRELAYDYAERAIALCETRGERWIRSHVLWAFAVGAWRETDRHRARAIALDGFATAAEIGDGYGGATCLEILMWSEASAGRLERAARLVGAAESLWAAIGHPVRSWGTRPQHDAAIRTIRAGLSAHELAALTAAGRAAGMDGIAAEIVDDGVDHDPLTRRQREIVDLVAQGRSNKEIARTLLITVRTVETHVGRIFTRLGVASRTQLVAWRSRQEG